MLDIDWGPIRVVVFDLDGTLYSQQRLRWRMAVALGLHCVAHPSDASVLRVIAAVRRAREELAARDARDIVTQQYEVPARRLGVPPSRVRAVVETWMHERPLRYLLACRFPLVPQVFAELRARRRTIAVLSDYPARRKLEVLGLDADVVVSSTDPEINRLKPNPAGLQQVLALTAARPSECLMIGDREDTDGECARRLSVRCLLKSDTTVRGQDRFARFADLLATFPTL